MDSRRLFERLPGDVLLIFARDVEHIWEKDLRCEWVDGHETDLVDPTATPHIQRLVPLYGVLHRTHDYADQADEVFYAYPSWYNLPRLQATKIGGLPGWIQGEPDRAGGRFLCELTSIQPEPDTPYPYVNVAAPQPFFSEERERLLMFGDVGSAYLLLGRNARLKWVIQDY